MFRRFQIFLAVILWGFSSWALDRGLDAGSELLLRSSSNAIDFSPCNDDPKSSCAVLASTPRTMFGLRYKHECELRVVDRNVAKIELNRGERALRVTSVRRDQNQQIITAVLGGAAHPIELGCDRVEIVQGSENRIPDVLLDDYALAGLESKLRVIKFVPDQMAPAVEANKPAKQTQQAEPGASR